MTNLSEPPVSYLIAAALVVFGIWALARGARGVSVGLADATALELVRGIRLAVFALVAGFFAIGLLVARPGFVALGAVILAEEVCETGVLALLVRLGDRGAAGRVPRRRSPGAEARADGGCTTTSAAPPPTGRSARHGPPRSGLRSRAD